MCINCAFVSSCASALWVLRWLVLVDVKLRHIHRKINVQRKHTNMVLTSNAEVIIKKFTRVYAMPLCSTLITLFPYPWGMSPTTMTSKLSPSFISTEIRVPRMTYTWLYNKKMCLHQNSPITKNAHVNTKQMLCKSCAWCPCTCTRLKVETNNKKQ